MYAQEQEEWRPIDGFPDYLVSDHGRVVSTKKWRGQPGRVLGGSRNPSGYRTMFLTDVNGKVHTVAVHRLVGEAFLGPLPDGQHTRHLDGNKLNNRLGNLAYGTPSENEHDKVRHGTQYPARKTHCLRGHAFDDVNTYRHANGRRECRNCMRDRKSRNQRIRRAAARMEAAA